MYSALWIAPAQALCPRQPGFAGTIFINALSQTARTALIIAPLAGEAVGAGVLFLRARIVFRHEHQSLEPRDSYKGHDALLVMTGALIAAFPAHELKPLLEEVGDDYEPHDGVRERKIQEIPGHESREERERERGAHEGLL